MANLDSLYVTMPPLQQVIHDVTTGELLANGKVYFYRDTARTELKPVYQLSQMPDNSYVYNPLPNPLILSGIGSYVDGNGANIIPYLKPWTNDGDVDLYYIRVYSEDDVFQFDLMAWPNGVSAPDPEPEFISWVNQISNPQFVEANFSSRLAQPQTFNVSTGNQVTTIANGWDLITSGTGTVTVNWLAVVDVGIVSSPSYVMDIQSSGTSYLALRQRFNHSPRLFLNQFVQGSIVARNMNAGTSEITLRFVPSAGDAYVLGTGDVENTVFRYVGGVVEIDGTPNPDSSSTGYVDFIIEFQPVSHIRVTSAQLMAVPDADAIFPFIEQSEAKQVDGTYNLDRAGLIYKPVAGFLTGWDFPLNPGQFGGGHGGNLNANAAAAQGGYVWDQTICGRTTANFTVDRDAALQTMRFTATGNNSAFFMMQYLPKQEAIEAILSPLSVHVQLQTQVAANAVMRVYLFRAPSTAAYPSIPYHASGSGAGTVIGSLGADGVFSLSAAGWTEVPHPQQPPAIANISGATLTDKGFGFSGWRDLDPAHLSDTDKFAIVVTFGNLQSGNIVHVKSINLCPGSIPTVPAMQTLEQVYLDCASFYSKSYRDGLYPIPSTTVNQGEIVVQAPYYNTGTGHISWPAHTLRFARKHVIPSANQIYLYSPHSSNLNHISIGVAKASPPSGSIVWPDTNLDIGNPRVAPSGTVKVYYADISQESVFLAPAITLLANSPDVSPRFVGYQYIVDCRLGVTHTP